MSQYTKETMQQMLLEGKFNEVEKEIYKIKQKEGSDELKSLINEILSSSQGYKTAREIANKYGYGTMRKKFINIRTITGDELQIISWYAIKKGKKIGRKKAGPNGRGLHIFLKHWGFIGIKSLGNIAKVARLGVSCQSYDLASKELKEQGYLIDPVTVGNATQKIGEYAQEDRDTILLHPGESFAGKRIIIAIDGGRIRTRKNKTGRYSKDQKIAKYETNWKEPKLLTIAELDDKGKMKRPKNDNDHTVMKPIYEATMGNHDEIFKILENIARNCKLQEAKEIILTGDGAQWIWSKYEEFIKTLGIEYKSTLILDYFHATEHINGIVELAEIKDKKEQTKWYNHLITLLRQGEFKILKNEVKNKAKQIKNPKLLDLFEYFEKNKERIRYNEYEKNNQPIGSGIVESAIRRVINLKLKSPSNFWKVDNLEKMLQLRCILMADRWNIFINNLSSKIRFS